MPPEERSAVPEAVDHVTIVERSDGRRTYRRDVVTRSGNWVRLDRTNDRGSTTHYSHLPSATSFSSGHGPDGGITAIRVERDPSASPYYRMHRTATDQRERRLGESCRVWRIAPVGELAGNHSWLSCETHDGIQLWIQELWGVSGTPLSESRAVSVTRRRVGVDGAQPSARFFAIATFTAGSAWSEPGPDYRVVLHSASARGGGPGRQIIQRRGAFRSVDFQEHDGSRRLNMNRGESTFYYEEEPGGRPIRLWVNRMPDDNSVNMVGRQVPVEGREPETILGETCVWMQSTLLISHYRRIACETADGIVLATDEQSMAGHTVYRATSVSRTRLTPVDFRLPDRALSLDGWGAASD